jgi:hypothetical protein
MRESEVAQIIKSVLKNSAGQADNDELDKMKCKS